VLYACRHWYGTPCERERGEKNYITHTPNKLAGKKESWAAATRPTPEQLPYLSNRWPWHYVVLNNNISGVIRNMTDRHAVAVHVGKPSPFHQEWVRTYVYFHDFEGLSAERGHLVRTDNFVCPGGHQWRVGFYPGGENNIDTADGMTSIVLYNRSNADVLFGFCVKDDTGREVGGTACHQLRSGKRATISNFLKRSKIMKFLVDGTLVIEVRMRELSEPTKLIPTRYTRENIRHMFQDEETADILIRVEEEWESNSMELVDTPQAAIHAYRLGGEGGVPRWGLRSRSKSRSKSRPHDRKDRSKSRSRSGYNADKEKRLGVQREETEHQASRRREHPQQRQGESLHDYWRRRAEESKERVSTASMSSASDADTLGSGAPSLASRGLIDMPSLAEGQLFY
jgi:hypothetical protein